MIPSVRLARHDDAEAIFDLLELMHEESGEDAYDPAKVRAQIHALIAGGVVAVAEQDYRIVGTIGVGMAQPWFSDVHRLVDYWTFVHPDYRQSRHARDMLTFVNNCAKELRIKLVMAVTSNQETEGKCRLFGRILRKSGEIFVGGAA